MLGNERFLRIRRGLQGWEVAGISNVPEHDTDIPKEAIPFDALDRGLPEQDTEFLIRESQKITQTVFENLLPRMESDVTAGLRETVPGTHREAVVATVKAVSDQRTQFLGNRALVFNGKVGNTSRSIDVVRAGNGIRGAGVDTGGAFSAVIPDWLVRLQWKGGDQLGKEKPRSYPAMDLHTGLSVPSQSRLGGEISFKNRPGVYIVTLDTAEFLHRKIEVLQLCLDNVVVVIIPGIAGDLVVRIGVSRSRIVVEGEADDGLGTGKNLAGISSAFGVSLKPLHITGLSLGNPLQEIISMPCPEARGYPAIFKAEFFGNELDVSLGDDWIHGDRA